MTKRPGTIFACTIVVMLVSVFSGCGSDRASTQLLPETAAAQQQPHPLGRVEQAEFTVVPGSIGRELRGRVPVWVPHASYVKATTTTSCIYLPDNRSGNVYIYDTSSLQQIGELTSREEYGWGAAATRLRVYLGTYYDTIDVYKPCNGTHPTRTLVGAGNGYPMGITVAGDGTTYADEWPSNKVDIWANRGHSMSSDSQQSATYYLAVDKAGDVFTSGFAKSTSTEGIVDKCTALVKKCATIITGIKFPGGIAFDKAENLYSFDEIRDILTEYSGCTSVPAKCVQVGSLQITSSAIFTGLALDTSDKNLWAASYSYASIYGCYGTFPTCGFAYDVILPIKFGRNGGVTQAQDSSPLSIAYWKPSGF